MPPAARVNPASLVNLVNLETVSKSYGVRPLLHEVSLGVQAGERIGVLGVNGGGKTTLLEVMAAIEPPDSGRVSHSRSLRMAVVTQRDELPEAATVREVALARWQHGPEHEWAGDPHVRSVLDGLGLTGVGLDRPIAGLSGGERRRVALAAALAADLDLVMLDEPTNHLDVDGVRWLAEHLLARRCATVVVTHDRWFLDTVCSRTWEVVDGRVEQYDGGYADWVFARAERVRQAESAESTRRNLARTELAWLRRGAPARTSKPRFRIDAAEALIADVPPPRDTVELMSFARRRLGRTVIELEDVTATVGDGRTLLDRVTWRIGPGDRLGIVGVNGSGKTTLLRLVAGELPLQSGRRIEGPTVRMAHLRQQLTDLPETMRVLDAVEEVARYVQLGKQELSASQLAERLGFTPARQRTPVGDLSGGERRRLQLTRLLMSEPNVLLLDEPTNDLDIDTLQQLERLLDSWAGTLVVVSHDRYLVERVCDTVVALFGDGRITHLPGGIDEYLARRDATLAAARPARSAGSTGSASGAAGARPGSSAGTGVTAAELRTARKDVVRLERQLDRLAERQAVLQQALLDAGSDVDRLVELDAKLRALLAEKDELELAWLTAAEAVDNP
jgi:ABC transport system ATP-binding/permease protein